MYVYVTYRVYRDTCSVNGQFKIKQDPLDNKTDLSKNETNSSRREMYNHF